MKPGRIVAIVLGSLLALPSLAMIFGGGVVTVASAIERGDDGYFDATLDRLSTATPAITTGDLDFRSDPGPEWVLDYLDVSVRFQLTGAAGDADLFLGIGPQTSVDAFLAGVGHDEVREIRTGSGLTYNNVPGDQVASIPTDQDFWVVSASGTGDQVVEWDVTEGNWVVVLMNADGSAGILADVTVGVRSGAILAIGIVLLIGGVVVLAVAVSIIVVAARRRTPEPEEVLEQPTPQVLAPVAVHPVRLDAAIDSPLSPWLWLVKWLFAIPHFVLLGFLWIAVLVLTLIAGVAILFTGRYPQGIFDFNLGVMRWTWRVIFYAASGGLGTDRYPPFSLAAKPDYPATLDIPYPGQLSRGLVLIKWWLLAIPHYLVLALIAGGGSSWWRDDGWGTSGSAGLLGVLVLIAAVTLLFTGRYPQSLFDLIIGLNRWVFRVLAYVGLMTDDYPPFRLDQGGQDPGTVRIQE